jgi:hypothetical protein
VALSTRRVLPRPLNLSVPSVPRPGRRAISATIGIAFLVVLVDAVFHPRAFSDMWTIQAIERLTGSAGALAILAAALVVFFARRLWASTIATALPGLFKRLDGAVDGLPLIHAAPVGHDEARPHAHALTSLVFFDGDRVSKVYAPGLLPRALYRIAFQAPFPYVRNHAALQAAMHRRNLAGQLTEYWYGSSRVARITDIDRIDGRYALTSERIAGFVPTNRYVAKSFLSGLRARFEEAGLPTWQIDPRQPRALDNLLETADGAFHVVDLESGLVSPLASLKTWRRALRRGRMPLFDEVFFDVTRAYVARTEPAMRAKMGDLWVARLHDTIDAADSATCAWHASEPRLWNRLLTGIVTGFGVRTWPTRLRVRFAGGSNEAQPGVERVAETWKAEERITADECPRPDFARPGRSRPTRAVPLRPLAPVTRLPTPYPSTHPQSAPRVA